VSRSLLLQAALIAVLILINGFFAAAEIAILSARRSRLQALAREGSRRAEAALRLKANLDRFLTTVQIGVTLVTTLASAVGGAAVMRRLEAIAEALPLPWAQAVAQPAAVIGVVFTIAYLSLVVGELVPKAIAVRNSEALACWMAPPIEAISRLGRPAVAAVMASSRLVLRLLGRKEEQLPALHTLADLRAIVREAEDEGLVRNVVTGAVAFHDLEVREVLTPRHQIRALPLQAGAEEARGLLRANAHSRLPVYDGAIDNIVGFVYARDLYESALDGRPLELAKLLRPMILVPGSKRATDLLAEMRAQGIQMAHVVDEHGMLKGLVTLEDLVEVIVGDIPDEHEQAVEAVRRLDDGSLEVEGAVPVYQLNESHGLDLPESTEYVTVAGLVLASFGSIPHAGEATTIGSHGVAVVEVAGHRIKRVRIRPGVRPE
jgi:putative hemolysin